MNQETMITNQRMMKALQHVAAIKAGSHAAHP